MSKSIWKFEIPLQRDEYGKFELDMPLNAHPLYAGEDPGGRHCVWAFVPDTNAEKERRAFCRAGTGEPMPTGKFTRHLSTYVTSTYVWHIFTEPTQ